MRFLRKKLNGVNYRVCKASVRQKPKRNAYQRNYSAFKSSEEKAKDNEYQRKYRAAKASEEQKSKRNEYERKH